MDDDESNVAIPGLAAADEVPLVATEPDPSTDSFTWSDAYVVEDLPKINVGQPTAEFMEDAARDPDEASQLVCMGDASGSDFCGVIASTEPDIAGVTFGERDVRAWSWNNVPEEAAAVQFRDQDGTQTWQRPADSLVRFVMFPDTIPDDPDGLCPCRFDAIDSDGEVITSVDIRTGEYVDS
ncbi:MAG TPA: hypothetical protein VLS86_02720 [Acidimicrobiia bacterium]|nr:hypothetical protein [Acidimicrobiia bacterium]